MLAYGMVRTTYSPVEVTMFKTGENELTLPHLYSCSEQLNLLRTMLLREDGDVLQIGEGIPRSWLALGQHVAVDSAPTLFGDVNYRIAISSDGVAMVRITPPVRRAPAEIVIHLRVPSMKPIESVQGASPKEFSYSGEAITFPNLKHSVEVKVRFQQ